MIEKNEKELNNAKVLIVGAAGFIGGFLVMMSLDVGLG